jgi:hypothetical protein
MQEGSTDVASSVATGEGRISMLRHAARDALNSAAKGTNLQSLKPREFVCGLAGALGVPEERTISVVHAVVAAELRSWLLAIAASRRSGAYERAASDLRRLLRAVNVFPLPAASAQASLIGDALRDKLTLSEMEDLLKELVRFPSDFYCFSVKTVP